ncbi:MAG: hypothetical protein ACRD33_00075 [Candidatus Acidiferrales bacterium]
MNFGKDLSDGEQLVVIGLLIGAAYLIYKAVQGVEGFTQGVSQVASDTANAIETGVDNETLDVATGGSILNYLP